MTETDPLRAALFKEEKVKINLLSELSPISNIVAWDMLVLATCSQGKTEEFDFLNNVLADVFIKDENLPIVCLYESQYGYLLLPKNNWLHNDLAENPTDPARLDEENISTINFHLRVRIDPPIGVNQRQVKLHDCILRTPSPKEIEILKDLQEALKQDFPINLDRQQTLHDLDIAAQIMGMDLRRFPYTQSIFEPSPSLMLSDESLRNISPIFSREVMNKAIDGTLRNLTKTELFNPEQE